MRHNEVRDFTAELLSECGKDVSTEPLLQQQVKLYKDQQFNQMKLVRMLQSEDSGLK